MSRNNANSDKTEGFPLEPVTVSTELDGEQITIDAAHHVINDEAELLRLYIEGRDGGWDVSIPFGRDDTAWAHSDVGRRALGLDTHSDDADVEADDAELVADGGRDVPFCICGAPLIDTADLSVLHPPLQATTYPDVMLDAECSDCGRSVRSTIGPDAVDAVWDVHNGPRRRDNNDDDDRLVADGGYRPVVPDNPAGVVEFGSVECGDTVTTADGTVVGHVTGTRVAEMHQYPDEYVIEYVTGTGETRSEVFGGRQITVCETCGDIVLPSGEVAAGHDAGQCNGGD